MRKSLPKGGFPKSIPLPRSGLERNTLAMGYDGSRTIQARWVNEWYSTVGWTNSAGNVVRWA